MIIKRQKKQGRDDHKTVNTVLDHAYLVSFAVCYPYILFHF